MASSTCSRTFSSNLLGSLLFIVFGVVSVGVLGCAGIANIGVEPRALNSKPLTVAVVCSPASILTTQRSTCTAKVTGSGHYSSAVIWSLSPSSMGSISTSGVFTPSTSGTATITAISRENPSRSGSSIVSVTVPSTITAVAVTCSPTPIFPNQTSSCAARVSGTGNFSNGVTWSVGPSGVGSISSSGTFTPLITGTATITATSTQDATKSGSMIVSVNALPAPTTPVIVPSILLSGQQATAIVTCFVRGAQADTQVQLFRLDSGTAVLVGTMNDQGQNGDRAAGDQVYTIAASLTAPAAASLPMQVVVTTGVNGTTSVGTVVPVIQIPVYPNETDVNEAEAQLYSTAIQTRSTFSSPDWTNAKLFQGVGNNLVSMFDEMAGVVNQNPALQSAAQRSSSLKRSALNSPRPAGIVQSILDVLTFGLLSPAQNAQACNQLLDSLSGFPPPSPYPVLSPDDPQMQIFAQDLTTACTTAGNCQGLFTESDFLTNTANSYTAYLWAQEYIATGGPLATPVAGCGGAVSQSLANVAVKSEASQFTDLAGDGLTQLAGGGQIAQQATGVANDTLVGWVVDNSGKPTVVIGQAGANETFAAPAGNYNLAMSAGGSQPNATVTGPVYPLGTTNITPEFGGIILVLPPNITNVNPTSGPVGTPVYITGSNFGSAYDQVAFNGAAATVLSALDGQIEALVPAGASSGPITVNSLGGVATSPISFSVTSGVYGNPTPIITNLSPASAPVGTQSLTLTINGTGFLSSSDVTFNGNGRLVTFISATQLTVALTTADLSAPGAYPVVVVNPSPGGGASSAVNFSVTGSSLGNGEWTWMGGSDTVNAPGVYGTQGVPAATNVPGARNSAVSWTDSSGNLWLFSGAGFDSSGALGFLNDLWEFNPSNETWTWVNGSNTKGASGSYGTLGVPSATNVPGSRETSTAWIDGNSNLWLFGGGGTDSAGSQFFLNDLWMFSLANKSWTWVSGSSQGGAIGAYGTQGVASTTNVPGARLGAVSWADGNGNFWLFGGIADYSPNNPSIFNDLWMFSPADKSWTWVSGSSQEGAIGVYGTQGVAAPTNVPRARYSSVSWVDSNGEFWLFGGSTVDSAGNSVFLNDLWVFNPAKDTWTWISGSSQVGALGIYGTLGVASVANAPGARSYSLSWIDDSGNLWLFGGIGNDSTGGGGNLNDLWKFDPHFKTWTWEGGSDTRWATNVYGTLGIPGPTNVPGAREGSVGWVDENGNLWLFGGYQIGVGFYGDLWRYQP